MRNEPLKADSFRLQFRRVGNMKDTRAEVLKRVIESQHGGTATFARSVRVLPSKTKKGSMEALCRFIHGAAIVSSSSVTQRSVCHGRERFSR